jgi:hypothetical protein
MSCHSSLAPSSPASSCCSSATSSPPLPLVLDSSFVGAVLTYNTPDTKPAGPKYQKSCKTCGKKGHTTPTCDKRFCTHCQRVGHTLSQCHQSPPALKKAKVIPAAAESLVSFLGQTLITKFTTECEAECARKVADYAAKVGGMTVEQLCQEMSARASSSS